MKKLKFKHTILACFIGCTVQAIACNFAPLLFVGWENEFGISMPQLTTLITITFFTQIIVDLASAKFADKIGYKKCLVIAHICEGAGFIMMATLPYIINNTFAALVISITVYSIGSGLLEVLVSPVIESCPTDNKAGYMSLLHSFYCWGTVATILISTLYFIIFGRENWRYLALFWAIYSLLNAVLFIFVPIIEPEEESKNQKFSSLFKNKFFIVAIIIMICSGAAELTMSQWASAFAETGLNVSKTIGDLAGPMAFAVLMGTGRIIFSKLSSRIKIENYLFMSAVVCILSYLIACLSPSPVFSLFGCALCGLSVSAMWPGTISLTTKVIPNASTTLFAFLAVSGDIGCTTGPTVIGWVSDAFGGDLKKGLIFSIIFPITIILILLIYKRQQKRQG